MNREAFLTRISDCLKDYVESIPFDNIAVVLAWLYFLEHSTQDIPEAFDAWSPNSPEMADIYGGTNCVGATQILREWLAERDVSTRLIISPSNRLPEGVSKDEVPFQHMALFGIDPESGAYYLVEPGLGIVFPVPTDSQLQLYSEKIYTARASEAEGTLKILRGADNTLRVFDFIQLPEQGDAEKLVQKPLLRATTHFKTEAFSDKGDLVASVRVDVFKETVTLQHGADKQTVPFAAVESLFGTQTFEQVAQDLGNEDTAQLRQRIETLIERKADIVGMWYEGIQRRYYLEHSDLLSPFETSWKDLEAKGYRGGGVIVCLINDKHQVMLYTVPEGKAKPFLNREVGQKNLFVETADNTVPGGTTATLEDFATNFQRALEEEVGIPAPSSYTYREVDYMPGIRARCVVMKVDTETIETVRARHELRNRIPGKIPEFGPTEWISLDDLSNQPVEPNARPILEKLIAAKLVV